LGHGLECSVGLLELQVEPLYLLVVGTVVEQCFQGRSVRGSGGEGADRRGGGKGLATGAASGAKGSSKRRSTSWKAEGTSIRVGLAPPRAQK
jgi:hypothetical protein